MDRLYIQEKEILDILPPFKKIRVYAITSDKTKMDIGYYPTNIYTLKKVERIRSDIEDVYKRDFKKMKEAICNY